MGRRISTIHYRINQLPVTQLVIGPVIGPVIRYTAPLLLVGLLFSGQGALAQTEMRRGVLPVTRLTDWESQADATLSSGVLAELESDPNFAGDFELIYGTAAQILDGYVVVNRAGYFPENAGIPRDQQLSPAQAVYYFYKLPNNNTLVLYRTPAENTSRYMIRKPGAGFLLPQS
jgi:hypothetical protein